MLKIWLAVLSAFALVASAQAQQTCASYRVVVNSPEDKLMLAVNGADNPQEQVSALQTFLSQYPKSNFVPCAYQNLTKAYVKLKDYNNAIAAGQKAEAAGYMDVPFLENLLQAYIATGTASDSAFALINKAPEVIKAESVVTRPVGESDADYAAAEKQSQAGAANERDYMKYAFFQLLAHVSEPAKQISVLDQFTTVYPDALQKNAGLINYQYATAYNALNQTDKADEYAQKTVAVEPNNVEALNMLAFDYAIGRNDKNFDIASADAEKVLQLVPAMKTPAGMSDEQFKVLQNGLLGTANLCLGFIQLVHASSGPRYSTHAHMAPAIDHLKSAADLLSNNATLQSGAWFYLGTAYEKEYPAEHRDAIAALEKSVALQSPWQPSARDLLEKVKRAMH